MNSFYFIISNDVFIDFLNLILLMYYVGEKGEEIRSSLVFSVNRELFSKYVFSLKKIL